MKRFLLAALIVLFLMIHLTAYASDERISGLFTYSLKGNGTATIIRYDWENSEGNVYIPQMLDGYTVTAIGEKAFAGGDKAVIISIPNSITSIGDFAFADSAIISVSIPANTQRIGNGILMNCKQLNMISVDPANAYYTLVDNALYEKATKKLIAVPYTYLPHIPDGIKEIGDYAFYGHNISGFDSFLPASVTKIGHHAFENATLSYAQQEEKWLVPQQIDFIGDYAFSNAVFQASYSIPTEKGGNVVHLFNDLTYLGAGAFKNADLKCASNYTGNWGEDTCIVCVFGHVDTIPDEAFAYITPNSHMIWHITAPEYQYIGDRAFAANPGSENYLFFQHTKAKPGTPHIISMGQYVFENARVYGEMFVHGDNLKAHSFSGMQRVERENESHTKFTKQRYDYYWQTYRRDIDPVVVYFDASTVEIPDYSFQGFFYGINFDYFVTHYENIIRIGEGAFQGAGYLLLDNVSKKYYNYKYTSWKYAMNLSKFVNINTISKYSFADTNDMTEFVCPSNLISIEDYAFSCSGIETIVLPETLISIGECAFTGCANLKEITLPVSINSIGENAFDRTNITLLVESGSYAALWAQENGYRYKYIGENELDWLNN